MSIKSILTLTFTLLTFSAIADTLPEWQYQQQLPGHPSLRASAIADGVLWVGGTSGKIFISQNQGQSWQDISLPGEPTMDIRDIQAFSAETAIAMTVGSGKASRLYLTNNGGRHWSLLLLNRHPEGFFDSITFWDRDNGLLMGDPVDGYYQILRTTDGGKHWTRVPAHQLPPVMEKESAFAASGNTLITGEGQQAWLTTGGYSASVYHSSDQGQSWTRYKSPLYNKTQTAGGYGLALNQQHALFILGGDYQHRAGKYQNMAKWQPKQQTWRKVNRLQKGLRTAMACHVSLCVSTGKMGNDYSRDQGKTWYHWNKAGYYTLASNNGLILAAGHDGRVGVLVAAPPSTN